MSSSSYYHMTRTYSSRRRKQPDLWNLHARRVRLRDGRVSDAEGWGDGEAEEGSMVVITQVERVNELLSEMDDGDENGHDELRAEGVGLEQSGPGHTYMNPLATKDSMDSDGSLGLFEGAVEEQTQPNSCVAGDMVRVLSQGELWALLQCPGLRRLTTDSYESVCSYFGAVLGTYSTLREVRLPSYRTMSRSWRPAVLGALAVSSDKFTVPVESDGAFSGEQSLQYVNSMQYAVHDLANPLIWSEFIASPRMKETYGTINLHSSSGKSNIVRALE